MGAMLAMACSAGFGGSIPLAVKRGQKDVDPKALPLTAITIATQGAAIPIQRIELENRETGERSTVMLAKSFGASRPDYLTAVTNGKQALSMIIVALKPGTYRLWAIEFNVSGKHDIDSYYVYLESRAYLFEVKPGAVNYVGTLVVDGNRDKTGAPRSGTVNRAVADSVHPTIAREVYTNDSQQASFEAWISTELTQVRDAKWASDEVPGLANLPRVFSSPLLEWPADS